MVRQCFISGCVTNKWRRQWMDKRPALFSFPKSPGVFYEWIKKIPKREREPLFTDTICSLHFNAKDIIKYYEITKLQGQPVSKVERIERGCWTLQKKAVPHYFNNDNPDEDLVVKDVKHREQNGEYNSNVTTPISHEEYHCSEDSLAVMPAVHLDHSYNLPAEMSKERTSSESCKPNPEYSITDLYEDSLELILPAKWSYIHNPEDNSTSFIRCGDGMSIPRSIRFLGSCYPVINVNHHTIFHKRVTSKNDLQEIVGYVDKICEKNGNNCK